MSKLFLEKDDNGLRITAHDPTPTLSKEEEKFYLNFVSGSDTLKVVLTSLSMQSLALQCIALMPALAPQYCVPSVEEAIRLPARVLRELDDRSIQILLRECQSDALIIFLWYMKDGELLRRFMHNMSQRAAQMLMEDMNEKWHGKDPDQALQTEALGGRECVQEIMAIVQRLIHEGQIPNILGLE